jgi:LysM repeat protein
VADDVARGSSTPLAINAYRREQAHAASLQSGVQLASLDVITCDALTPEEEALLAMQSPSDERIKAGVTAMDRNGSDVASDSYTVRAGDNLSKIARRYGISVGELAAINGLENSKIAPGQRLSLWGGSVPLDMAYALRDRLYAQDNAQRFATVSGEQVGPTIERAQRLGIYSGEPTTTPTTPLAGGRAIPEFSSWDGKSGSPSATQAHPFYGTFQNQVSVGIQEGVVYVAGPELAAAKLSAFLLGTAGKGIQLFNNILRGGDAALAGGEEVIIGQVAANRGSGAFLEGTQGGAGLGKLADRTVNVTEKGLNIVETHLRKFGDVPENTMMLDRLRTAMSQGQKVSGADASFYTHELAEATRMRAGMSYDVAHAASLQKYQVSPYSVYHPDVIQTVNQQIPGSFNSSWLRFWGQGK